MHPEESTSFPLQISRRLTAGVALLLCCLLLPVSLLGDSSHARLTAQSAGLDGKASVTILITDSGLGGLSVVARIDSLMRQCCPVPKIQLIYANALPDNEHPYNRMATMAEKATTFSAALKGFVERFDPDVILIACNTLSVVYPETEFASQAPVPVFGIVDIAADMISALATGQRDRDVIVMGTPTTAGSHAYRDALSARGISAKAVIEQGCDQLETEIQSDPHSDMVRSLVEMYAAEALALRDSSAARLEPIVALCCTHYPYAGDAFESAFLALTRKTPVIINPNRGMAEALLDGADCHVSDALDISVNVVSKVVLLSADVQNIARMLERTSPASAEALRSYSLDSTLFAFELK